MEGMDERPVLIRHAPIAKRRERRLPGGALFEDGHLRVQMAHQNVGEDARRHVDGMAGLRCR